MNEYERVDKNMSRVICLLIASIVFDGIAIFCAMMA